MARMSAQAAARPTTKLRRSEDHLQVLLGKGAMRDCSARRTYPAEERRTITTKVVR
jgi:hypothetical protein